MIARSLVLGFFVPALCLALTSCGESAKVKSHPDMAGSLVGAGAAFPNPLYQKWCEEFTRAHPKMEVEYASVGSGKGVERFLKEEVDFGASDGAMSDDEIAKVGRGVLLVPTTAGMIVLAYNPEGLPHRGLKLPRDVYADMFLGKITKWNDPRIAAANPDVKLPALQIYLAVRQDSSGTTFAFTNHLSAISPEWKSSHGAGKSIDWKASAHRAPGNEGVAALVQRNPGAIGYLEMGLAQRLGLPMAVLQNKAGTYVRPLSGTGLAALLEHKMPADFRDFVPDPEGTYSYPIITYTWLLLYKKYPNSAKTSAVKEYADWCLTEGQRFTEPLGFVRLPPSLAQSVIREIDKIQ